MTAHVVGVLAEALAQHRGGTGHSGDWECSCGVEGPERTHDLHVASVVAALPNIAIVPAIRGDWAPGRWWRVIAPNNIVWCETSDEQEARDAVRHADVLERIYDGPQLREWRAIAEGQA